MNNENVETLSDYFGDKIRRDREVQEEMKNFEKASEKMYETIEKNCSQRMTVNQIMATTIKGALIGATIGIIAVGIIKISTFVLKKIIFV